MKNNILRFRCHSCSRVNEIDLNLCTDDELQAECAWCGFYHDEQAIRQTQVWESGVDLQNVGVVDEVRSQSAHGLEALIAGINFDPPHPEQQAFLRPRPNIVYGSEFPVGIEAILGGHVTSDADWLNESKAWRTARARAREKRHEWLRKGGKL